MFVAVHILLEHLWGIKVNPRTTFHQLLKSQSEFKVDGHSFNPSYKLAWIEWSSEALNVITVVS